jgi:hypothetical protein
LGPKYSFSVIDNESVDDNIYKKIVMDIISFEQNACSSPHVIFLETKEEVKEFACRLGDEFNIASKKYPKMNGNYAEILNSRGKYLLDKSKDIVCSKELDWTILINDKICLEEPVKSRTVFLKKINDIFEIVPLVSNKIQTVGYALSDKKRAVDFFDKLTYKGVSRCVGLGTMHEYDTPWDGLLFIHRLVRWTYYR